MLTIRDVIFLLLDKRTIKEAYFRRYPIPMEGKNPQANEAIGKEKRRVSREFYRFLETLQKTKIQHDPDQEGILFLYKSELGGTHCDRSVAMVYSSDLLKEEDVSKVPIYGIHLMEWGKALCLMIPDYRLPHDYLLDLAVDFLHDISMFGSENEGKAEAIQSLHEAVEQPHKNPVDCKQEEEAFEELRARLVIPREEKYPEEDALKAVISRGKAEYTDYCRIEEMKNIKKILLENKADIENQMLREEIFRKLAKIPNMYYEFFRDVMEYTLRVPEGTKRIAEYLNIVADPTVKDVIEFVRELPDFREGTVTITVYSSDGSVKESYTREKYREIPKEVLEEVRKSKEYPIVYDEDCPKAAEGRNNRWEKAIEFNTGKKQLFGKLLHLPGSYSSFVIGVMQYVLAKRADSTRVFNVLKYLEVNKDADSSEVLRFVITQPDFMDQSQPDDDKRKRSTR